MKDHKRDSLLTTIKPLISAIGGVLIDVDHIKNGDVTLEVDGIIVAAIRLPALHGALERMIESVERELGTKLSDLSRTAKQRAIRLLDERGAFTLRRAVEDVADAMGVSRITVYNYLNSLHR
jgi:DNA invertase Pin-like site-specific DNA recombinase